MRRLDAIKHALADLERLLDLVRRARGIIGSYAKSYPHIPPGGRPCGCDRCNWLRDAER